ncbi:hypothetical protein T02_14168 [Trichinella nativa]|uniref:Uncharacterized protein n=2 Tax=Trichinella TaxID=6333 RepID=A0A0V1LUX2_9BILA|nr:hypothetical protein T05_15820 [Trichinella murrelli]KRX72147.1 hypothetical protein T06_10956 [Trichinella sp. T6]KRZ62978.1 hypothetical protein T02_14168 [Trichinella nativa]
MKKYTYQYNVENVKLIEERRFVFTAALILQIVYLSENQTQRKLFTDILHILLKISIFLNLFSWQV